MSYIRCVYYFEVPCYLTVFPVAFVLVDSVMVRHCAIHSVSKLGPTFTRTHIHTSQAYLQYSYSCHTRTHNTMHIVNLTVCVRQVQAESPAEITECWLRASSVQLYLLPVSQALRLSLPLAKALLWCHFKHFLAPDSFLSKQTQWKSFVTLLCCWVAFVH